MSNVSINKTGNVTIEGVGTQEQVVAATLVKRSVEGAISSGAITKADLQNPSALEKIKTAISLLNVGLDVKNLLSKVEVMFEIDLDTSQELLDHSSNELGIESPQIKGFQDLEKIGLVKNTISELKLELAGNKDVSVIKSKIQEASSQLKELSSVNPELAKFIEKEIGTEVLDIMTNDNISKDLKTTTFKEIANNGFHLHNCAVGLLEQENSPEKETKYTNQLIDMATTSLESTGKNVESQVKFIKENSLLAKCLVGSETLANQPSAQLHPGAWGLFMLQPNKIEDVNAVTTKYQQDFDEVVRTNDPKARSDQDTSPISRLPPMNDGVHLYTTNGNNRRSFQRVIDGDNVVTFSTKGNGLDLSVPKELLDISPDLKEMLEASKSGANSNDGKIHVFRFDALKIDGHQTAGFADNRITDDFKNITDKQRVLSGLSQQEDLFKPLEMALPKSLFVLGVAKTNSNLNKLPDTVKNWTNQGNNYVTQMVTSCEGETSLRLKRGANKDDTYRLGFVAQKELAGKNTELADARENTANLNNSQNVVSQIQVLKQSIQNIHPQEIDNIIKISSRLPVANAEKTRLLLEVSEIDKKLESNDPEINSTF